MQNVVNLHARPRGCDVDAHASLRGKHVTWTHIISNIYMGLPCISRQIINTPKPRIIYTRLLLFFFSVWDYSHLLSFDCRTRGASWSVG